LQFQDLEGVLPSSVTLNFAIEDRLSEFDLVIRPDEGFWKGGAFTFKVNVPETYNCAVSVL